MLAVRDQVRERTIWVQQFAPGEYRVRLRAKRGKGNLVTGIFVEKEKEIVRLHTVDAIYRIGHADYQAMQQMPPQSATSTAPATHSTTIEDVDGAIVRVKRMTDCIFVLGSKADQQVVLGIAQHDGRITVQTNCGLVVIDLAALAHLMALPARQQRVGSAFAWVAERATAVLFDDRPGDTLLAARIISQAPLVRLAISFEQGAALVPWFLRLWGLPLVLEPGAALPSPTTPPDQAAMEAVVARLIAEQLAQERRQREAQERRQREAQERRQREAQERRQREQAFAAQREATLQHLVRPDLIEATLERLYHLNHWAKARDLLLYVDRQGLYRIKADILRAAYAQGQVAPLQVIDGRHLFNPFGEPFYAVPFAAETLIEELIDPEWRTGEMDAELLAAYEAWRANHPAPTLNEMRAFEAQVVEPYVQAQMQALLDKALQHGTPIDCADLEYLRIRPNDIPLYGFAFGSWSELDDDDLAKLHPDYFSLVTFGYQSPTQRYRFHLPLLVTRTFLPAAVIDTLATSPDASRREEGECFGRAIAEEESLQYPIRDLVAQLGLPLSHYCPEGLRDKDDYIAQREMERAARWEYWYGGDWEEEQDTE